MYFVSKILDSTYVQLVCKICIQKLRWTALSHRVTQDKFRMRQIHVRQRQNAPKRNITPTRQMLGRFLFIFIFITTVQSTVFDLLDILIFRRGSQHKRGLLGLLRYPAELILSYRKSPIQRRQGSVCNTVNTFVQQKYKYIVQYSTYL